jgi:phosphoglycolate phosphatase
MTILAFDIDGTIYDAEPILESAFQRGISLFIKDSHLEELVVPGNEEIMSVVGIPIDQIFKTLFPSLSAEERLQLNEYCTVALVEAIEAEQGSIFEGVKKTVDYLAENAYTLHVASNGRKEYIEAILKTYGLFSRFSSPFIYLNETIKDKTAIVKEYCLLKNESELLIMIGDRYTDREAAEKNNVPFIACDFGHAPEEIEGCRYIIQGFQEIPETVNRIEEELTGSRE